MSETADQPINPAAIMAAQLIRSHDTETGLRQFAYAVRDLAREKDRLAEALRHAQADLAASEQHVTAAETHNDELTEALRDAQATVQRVEALRRYPVEAWGGDSDGPVYAVDAADLDAALAGEGAAEPVAVVHRFIAGDPPTEAPWTAGEGAADQPQQ